MSPIFVFIFNSIFRAHDQDTYIMFTIQACMCEFNGKNKLFPIRKMENTVVYFMVNKGDINIMVSCRKSPCIIASV